MKDPKLSEYQASGKLTASAGVHFLLGAALVISASVLYSFVGVKLNIDWINPVFFALLVWFISIINSRIIEKGKVRSSSFGFIFGVLLGCISIYSSWLSLAHLSSSHIHSGNIGIAFSLGQLLNFSESILSTEWLVLFGYSVNPAFVVAIWLVEAIIITLVPSLMGFYLASNKSFCEDCEDWLESEGDLLAFYSDEPDKLKREFVLGSYGFMEEGKGIFNVPTHDYFVLESELCASCNDFFTFRLKKMKKESDLDKAKPSNFSKKMVATRPYYQHFSLLKAQFPVPEED